MLLVAATVVGLSLSTSGLVLDPETSAIDPPNAIRDVTYQIADSRPDALLGQDPGEHAGEPANLNSMPPLGEGPSQAGTVQQEQVETQLKQDLKSWQDKVSAYRKQAKTSGSKDMQQEAHILSTKYLFAANQWHKLRQVRGDDWNTEKANLDRAIADLQQEWGRAQQVTASR